MKKLKLWSAKQKLMREEKFSDYKARIWKMEQWFFKKHGSGLTLSVGGGDSPLGDVSCDPLMPKHVKCVGEYLPFRPKSFETVLVYSVLDHCLDPIKLLRECKNIQQSIDNANYNPVAYRIYLEDKFFYYKKKNSDT